MAQPQSLREAILQASGAGDVDADTNKNSVESTAYSPLDDLADLFSEPGSLSELDSLMAYINCYKLQMDREIAKRKQQYVEKTAQRASTKEELQSLQAQLDDLAEDFNSTNTLAQDTGSTINKMTANIKTLDSSKKNLTLSMTILKRLQMLVTAYDNLEKLLNNSDEDGTKMRNYAEVFQLLSAVLELMQHFQSYKSIDEVNTLDKKIASLKNRTIDEIFVDFELESKSQLHNDTLPDACRTLDTLGRPYREKLANWYVKNSLKELSNIFKSSEEAGSLENLNRRYIFFKRILNDFEMYHGPMFPKEWIMPIRLSQMFCELTKKDLQEVTSKETRLQDTHVDTQLLLTALSETLKFEEFLNDKFQLYGELGEEKKYRFDKTISDVFEPYLNVWIDHQSSVIEKKFLEYLNPANMFKKSGVAEADSASDPQPPVTGSNQKSGTPDSLVIENEEINVLESAADLFRTYRQMLGQLAALTSGKPLVHLSKLFSRYLKEYEHRILSGIVPTEKQIASANAQEKNEIVDMACLALNTSDYCSTTITQLEEKVVTLITPAELAKEVDFTDAKEVYLQLVTRCVSVIYVKIDDDLQYSWREMANNNWKLLNDVTGESRYLTSLKSTLDENCVLIFKKLAKSSYTRNFVDNLVDRVVLEMTQNIIRLHPITEIMAEQFTLDFQILKEFFLDLVVKAPNGARIRASKSFKKFLDTKVGGVLSLMKVLMIYVKPTDSYIVNYFCNIQDNNFDNFTKTLQLKGLLQNESTFEKDKFKYMDQFKSQLRLYQDSDNKPLEESNPFMEALNVTSGLKVRTSMFSPTSPQLMSPSVGTNISNFFNSQSNGFRIDRQSIFNTRDNFEKNITKTFGDSKINFGKLFKKTTN